MKRLKWLRNRDEPTQLTRPKGTDLEGKPAEPVEISVPTRDAVLGSLERVAKKPVPRDDSLGGDEPRGRGSNARNAHAELPPLSLLDLGAGHGVARVRDSAASCWPGPGHAISH